MGEICEVVIASGNRHKIKEIQQISESYSLLCHDPSELAQRLGLGAVPNVPEPEDTYFGNALLKARAFAEWSGMMALGDDSGLAVEALGGRPGVHSARYGGGVSDRERCALLLKEVAGLGLPDTAPRRAAFHCCLVLAQPDGAYTSVEVTLPGKLLTEFRGEHGFGYDPIVEIDGLGRTLAEVSFAELCVQGFRAKAMQQLVGKLKDTGLVGTKPEAGSRQLT